MPDVAYASASALIADALKILLPPQLLTIPEYAAEHRWLRSKSGGGLERWTNELASYLTEPAECLTSDEYLTVAVVGPGQCGKTSIAENWMLHGVACDPGDMLWYMQTETGVEGYVKDRINTMIDLHDALNGSLGRRTVDDSLSFKKFTHMSVQFLSATENNLINKTARRIVADEIDAYPEGLGDIMTLLNVRRQTYGKYSKIFALSHPDKATGLDPARDWTRGIMAVYADSDRRVRYMPCPHCETWSSLTPTGTRVYTLNYPAAAPLEEIEQLAHLVCPVNGCVLDERDRLAMNRTGEWVATGQEIAQDGIISGQRIKSKTAGFWITGLMSPFILGGLGGLARARVKAERELEVTGEEESLRNVLVKQFGIPYAPNRASGSVDANDLADRALSEINLQLGIVPDGVRFLTAAVDVQHGYFEYLVRGWGVSGESWIIDRGRILAETATSPDDWDKLLKEVFQKTYPLADGSGRVMAIRGSGYDSGGAPGVTQQGYFAFGRWRISRATRYLGVQDGRQVYSITPLKGSSGLNAPRLVVTFPDTTRKANIKASSGTVPVAAFNPNSFKDDLSGQLQRAEVGPLYVHCPPALRSQEKPHVFFEQMVSEHRLVTGRWEKITPHVRNEALDLMIMTHVVAHLHGLARIDWTKPPAFAAPWDTNSQVTKPSGTTGPDTPSGTPKIKAISSLVSRLAH